VDDVQAADAPGAVGPTEGEAVVPGLDGLDGALGAEGADGPPTLGLRGSDDVEGDELGIDAGLVAVAVDGDQVVVGGVVAPAQGRVGAMAVDMAAAICAPPERVPSNSVPSGPR
jgi:hypothetical protein